MKSLYDDNYFEKRYGKDKKRNLSFKEEIKFMSKCSEIKGNILDIGCSTGEFLSNFPKENCKLFEIEINDKAANAAKRIGIEIVSEYNNIESLDWIIYRGTIQHLDSPFRSLFKSYNTLKKGGRLAILATPNINSFYFKLFNDLPALDPKRNFYLPSIESMDNIMKIIGFEREKVEFPYLKSPYSNVYSDFYIFLKKLIRRLFLNKIKDTENCSFPGNMMNIIYKK